MQELLLLPGDGIGPEVVGACQRIIDHLIERHGLKVSMRAELIGGASIDACGEPISAQVIETARLAAAVLLGAVGGPKWKDQPFDKRPEEGLLTLRRELGLFANLRPAIGFPALAEASTLKPEIVAGLDVLVVRELIGGIYFGEPRGITLLPNGEERGVNTQSYTTSEIERVARVAFEAARKRSGRVCSVEKSNVMESGLLWRKVVSRIGMEDYPDISLDHMYADNCGMQLVRNPQQFDVILTDNLFGDILSDVAAMLTGSLGMLPSASLGMVGGVGLFEPIHGSAPDIAGKGMANPCAMILSFAMALRLSLGRPDLAEFLEQAIGRTLNDGIRTEDLTIGSAAQIEKVDTNGFTAALIERL